MALITVYLWDELSIISKVTPTFGQRIYYTVYSCTITVHYSGYTVPLLSPIIVHFTPYGEEYIL